MGLREDLEQLRGHLVPGRWVRGRLAVTRRGVEVPSLDAAACRWCWLGAMVRVVGGDDVRYNRLRAVLVGEMGKTLKGGQRFAEVNDRLGREACLAVVEGALRGLG